MTRRNKTACVAFAGMYLGFLSVLAPATWAGDEPERTDSAAPANAATQDATPEGETKDRYAVPQTQDVKELLQFIGEVQQHRPQSAAEALEHRRKALAAIKTAAERIQQLSPDKPSEAYQAAESVLLQIRISSAINAPAAEQQRMVDEIGKRLEDAPENRMNAALAFSLARVLEYSSNTEVAEQANRRFGELLAKQADPQLSQLGQTLIATSRRLGLVGNEMELTGTTMEGTPFDWKQYRGRVVLVDFWATWCGPCLAEMPNVRKNYDMYHDRGFDVVGVSVDDDREALGKFLQENPLPWTTLHESEGGHPAASYYGISAIPTTILVGRDGKVVSLAARGPQLTQLLEKLIGMKQEGQSTKDEGRSRKDEG